MQPLKLNLVQTATHWHAPARNRALLERWFAELSTDARLVVLPEMFNTGFTMSAAEVAESMAGPTVRWMQHQAALLDKAVCGSLAIREGSAHYNRFVLAMPDQTIVSYDKRHRFRMAGEHDHYEAGTRRSIIEIDGWRLCPMICYDLRFPVWFRNRGDYDVLLCVANWPAARHTAWRGLLQARAVENQCYSVGLNVLGTDGMGVTYAGGSAVYSPEGELLLDAGDHAGVHGAELNGEALVSYRERFPAWRDADAFVLPDESAAD